MNDQRIDEYREVYEKRWKASFNTPDADILALSNPKRQVEFFYYMYNNFISEAIESHFGNTNGKQLLELGCGRATSSIYQALRGGLDVTATDYSPAALKVAKNNCLEYGVEAKLRNENIFDLSFENNYFDVVISLGLMEHIEDSTTAYGEMLRVLRPGGLMIALNVPEHPQNIQRIANPFNKLLTACRTLMSGEENKPWLDKKTRSKTDNVYRSVLYGREVADLVMSCGFSDVKAYEVNPFPTFDPVPGHIDLLIVKTFQLMLWIRKKIDKTKDPFWCGEKNSRANFVVAIKGKVDVA